MKWKPKYLKNKVIYPNGDIHYNNVEGILQKVERANGWIEYFSDGKKHGTPAVISPDGKYREDWYNGKIVREHWGDKIIVREIQ